MKKQLFSIIIAVICIACLFSCKDKNNTDNKQPSAPQTNDQQNSNLQTNDQITVVFAKEKDRAFADELALTLSDKIGYSVPVVSADSAPSAGAVIVGNLGHGLSENAYIRIEDMEEPYELSAQYSVCSDGSSLALAYSDKVGFEAALAAVVENYETCGRVISAKGVVSEGHVSYRKRAEDAREKMRAEVVAEVAETHGSEIAQALKSYYNLFDDRIYIWLANLWDPVVGGFYYSNSGRDNVGFLPDIESTAQILSWLENSGMIDAYGGQWENILPESMKIKLLAFAQSLQDPDDGYFYHPQWTKESTTTSRRGRDNGWALSVISQLGGEPLYPNATNPEEEPDLVSYGGLTEGLGNSAVLAVSKVVLTANDLLPSHLHSPDAFEAYIRALNINGDSYAKGNTLAAQWRDIRAAGPAVIRRMFDVFAELQFPSTGMWEDTVSYNAVNGLFKISSLYQRFNEPVPHVDAAVKGVIEVLKNPEGAQHVCSVYNPWATLVALKGTMNFYQWNDIKKMLYEEAAALIDVTKEKYIPCLVDAGGFSYYHGHSASTSQGMMVATPSTYEADVNGTGIAFGALNCMTQVLGIGTAKIYSEEDYDYFINTIGSLGEIIKDEEMVAEPITFDDGDVPNTVSNSIPKYNEMYIDFDVVDDPNPTKSSDSDEKDMALRVEVLKLDGNYAASSATTQVPVMNPLAVGFCYAVEMDFMYESTDATSNMMSQLFLQDSKTSFGLSFNVYTKGSEKKIRIVEHANSGTKDVLATGLDFGEWINLRVEFYRTENKAIIYINGEPVSIADLYYQGSEDRNITKVGILHYRSVASTLYLDNILVEKLEKDFVPFGTSGGDVNLGTEDGSAVAKGPTTYEEGCPSADNVKIVKNSPSINSFITFNKVSDAVAKMLSAGNNALRVETFPGYTDLNVSYLDVMNVDYSEEADGFDKSYTFETDIYVDPSTAEGWFSQMFWYSGSSVSYSISLRAVDMGTSGKYVRIARNSINSNKNSIIKEGFVKVGEWFNLKIVFYKGSAADGSMTAARYFINDKYYAEDLTYRNAALESETPIEYVRMTFYSRDTKNLLYLDNISFTEQEDILPTAPEVEIVESDKIVDFEVGDPDSGLAVSYTTDEITSADLFRYSVVTDPKDAANKVLCAQVWSSGFSGITSGGTATKVPSLQYTRPDASASETDILNSAYVYCADYYISSVMPNAGSSEQTRPEGEMFALSIIQGGNQSYLYSFRFEMSDGKLTVKYGNSNSMITILLTEIGYDEWFDVRLEFYKNNGADDEATDAADGAAYRLIVTASDGTEYVGTVATENLDNRAASSTRLVKILTAFFASSVKRTVYIDNVSFVKNIGATDYTITETSTVNPPIDDSESGDNIEGGDGTESGGNTEGVSSVVTFEDGDPNAEKITNTNQNTDCFTFSTVSDPVNAANKCLKATVWANAYNSQTASTTAVTNGDYVSGSKMDGNAFHFETDLYISSKMPNSTSASAPTGNVLQITLLNGANKNVGSYTLGINDGSGTLAEPVVRIQQNFGQKTLLFNAIGDDGTGAIGFDEWFNVSFTLYVDADGNTGYLITVSTADGRSYQCFDPQVADTYKSNIDSDVAVKTAKITWVKTSTHRDVYLDNILCETLEGESYTPAE